MGTKVILVRHGETEWNKQRRFQGNKDISLNKLGQSQAQQLAIRLQDENIAAIYASDLIRAKKTADIIANEHGLSVIETAKLREINFGEWEGLTFSDLETNYSQGFNAWQDDPLEIAPPGGETLADFQERILPKLRKIITQYQEETILIVAHGGVNKVALATFLEVPLDKYWRLVQDNTAVNIMNFYDEEVTLELFNSTAHLD
jgi:alpha-ribazole phosphatase/probable phosphoglycerate mutase